MTNGQLNMVSVAASTQPATLEPGLRVAVLADGVPQSGGVFAGVLSGMQLQTKEKGLPDPGDTAVNLLAQLNVSASITHASEPETQKAEDSEKTDAPADTVLQSTEPPDIASQMVLGAYLQPGRMPEVVISTQTLAQTEQRVVKPAAEQDQQLPEIIRTTPMVDSQAVTATPEATAVAKQHRSDIVAQVATNRAEPIVAASAPPVAQTDQPTAKPEAGQSMQQPETTRNMLADRLPIATVAEATAVDAVKPATLTVAHAPQVVFKAVPTINRNHTEASLRTAEVNNPSPLPVDRLQNVAVGLNNQQPETSRTMPDYRQPIIEVAVAPLMAKPEVPAVAVAAVVVKPEAPAVAVAAVAKPEAPAVAVAAVVVKPEAPAAVQSAVSAPASSPEFELEMQISQSRPINAPAAVASVTTDIRVTAVVQEARNASQKINPEQQVDKVHTVNERNIAKEMAPSSLVAEPNGEPSPDSDSLFGSSNQEQPDVASDDQTLAQQNINGQFKVEHQKVASLSTKAVLTDPARQEIPEQIMHQVKDRLVQHDLKSGSQQITLTLSPDSLGELKMNLNLQGQKLSVEIIAENRSVRDVIVQHAEALKESLARQNITMESFDVTTGGKGSGSQGQNQDAWRELAKQQQQQRFWTPPRGYQAAQADIPSGHEAYQRPQGQTMLDIHY